MRSLAPCIVVCLAGLALMIAGGVAWATGTQYKGDPVRAYPSAVTFPFPPGIARLAPAELLAPSRGGEATTQ